MNSRSQRKRPLIAYFNSADVFEDFFPLYGKSQRQLLTGQNRGGNPRFISVLQREFGDVIRYYFSLAPAFSEARHVHSGHRVKSVVAPTVYRWLRVAARYRDWGRWQRAGGAYRRVMLTASSYAVHASWRLVGTLLRDQPDLLFLQGYTSGRFDVLLAMARVLGVPLVARDIGSTPDRYRGRAIKRWTIPRANAFIVSNRDEMEMLATRYRVPRARLWLILTPIDTAVFRPLDRAAACREAGLDAARRYLLFVGRLEDGHKRVIALLQTFAELANAHAGVDLLIAGEGPDGEMLRRMADERAPGRVRFLGWVSETQALVRLYNAAECLVLPSSFEGFPSVVGEAMACGTPVVGSHVGGIGEIVVQDETGWLFPPYDDAAFKRSMASVISRPEAVAAMRPRVRALAEARVSEAAVTVALQECLSSVGIARNSG